MKKLLWSTNNSAKQTFNYHHQFFCFGNHWQNFLFGRFKQAGVITFFTHVFQSGKKPSVFSINFAFFDKVFAEKHRNTLMRFSMKPVLYQQSSYRMKNRVIHSVG